MTEAERLQADIDRHYMLFTNKEWVDENITLPGKIDTPYTKDQIMAVPPTTTLPVPAGLKYLFCSSMGADCHN